MAEGLEEKRVGCYAQHVALPAVRVARELQVGPRARAEIVGDGVVGKQHPRARPVVGENGLRAGLAVLALVHAAQPQPLQQHALVDQQARVRRNRPRKAGQFAVVVAQTGVHSQRGRKQGEKAQQTRKAFFILGKVAADADHVRLHCRHAGKKRLHGRA